MRSSREARASDSQCRSRNCPRFDPSILRHSGIWGTEDEAVLNIVHKKRKNPKQSPLNKKNFFHRGLCTTNGPCIKTPGFSSVSLVLRTTAPVILAVFSNEGSYSPKHSLVFIFQLINHIIYGLCVKIEFIDWRYSQSCWYFRPL